MRAIIIVVAVVAVIAVVVIMAWGGAYNSLNSGNQAQQQAWADVESTLQRRSDLIPRLVNIVKGYAKHEKDVFVAVTEARAKVGQVNFNMASTNAEEMAKLQQAEKELSSSIARLLVVVEKYPELKASESFLQLQSQLEGTENRINVARERYNAAVREYNTSVNSFFLRFVAQAHGFQKAEYFKADKDALKAPDVKFD